MQGLQFHYLVVNHVTVERYNKFHKHDYAIVIRVRYSRCGNPETMKRDKRLSTQQGIANCRHHDGSQHAQLFSAVANPPSVFRGADHDALGKRQRLLLR